MYERHEIGASMGRLVESVRQAFVRRPAASTATREVPVQQQNGPPLVRHKTLKAISTALSVFVIVIVLTLARFAYAPPSAPLIAQDGITASQPGSPAPSVDTARKMEQVDPLPGDRSVPLTDVQVQRLMIQAGFPKNAIGPGVAIAKAESGWIPNNTNSAGNTAGVDRGLFQINDYYWRDDLAKIDWTDPQANTNLAFKVWQLSGWSAWSTYRKNPAFYLAQKAPAPEEIPADARLIPCRTDMFSGTKPNVAQVAHNVSGAMQFTGTIGGYINKNKYSGGKSDHAFGLALDFMTYEVQAKGGQIADYLVQNAKPLHVKYVMFAGRIDNLDGRGFVPFPDRGNPTDNHLDHVHVSFVEAPADVLCYPTWKASPPVWR